VTLSGSPAFIEYAGKPAKLPQATSLKQKIVFLHFQGDSWSDDLEADNAEAFLKELAHAQPAAIILIVDRFEELQKLAVTKGGFFRGP